MSDRVDTIFARASGVGAAAIAVLRISGPGSGGALAALAGGLPQPRLASLRRLRDPGSGDLLDRALVLWFPGPSSYTGEDSAELHLHGGGAVVAGVSAALVTLGCRPAEPGEFTRRAFLQGRMDLTQAEAVADLIAAETAAQRAQALRQAEGGLGRLYAEWTREATRVLAHQEAAIEFAMDDLPTDLDSQARIAAGTLGERIAAHLADGGRGERLREGLAIAILGAPNAGKSSLLNALAGREAAIVAAIPGTTRDVVECRIDLSGVPATLADTAGLRESEDVVEREGVRRALARANAADILVAVFAADAEPDAATLAAVQAAGQPLVVVNKIDLAPARPNIAGHATIPVSVLRGDGLTALRDQLVAAATARAGLADAPTLTRTRHRAALTEALHHLEVGMGARAPELAAEGYRAALLAIGRLTGRVGVEEILDSVFRDFCIGK
jgi:tRNA modification GTPase